MTLFNFRSSPVIWAVGLGAVSLLWAALGMSQPLWVDELHSNWVIADGWSEVTRRAKLGNQTPAYFYGLKCLSWFGDQQPSWIIRTPSVLAWGAAVASVAWILLSSTRTSALGVSRQSTANGQAVVVLWCCCVLFDVWQYFYAVEARVYGVVQLLNLWTWYMVSRLIGRTEQSGCLWIAWTVLAATMLHLHITAGLSLACQCAVLTVVATWTGRHRLYCSISQIFIGANAAWLAIDSQLIWQRRHQWDAFAGDGSWSNLLQVFPVAPLLLPIISGWLITKGIQGRVGRATFRLSVPLDGNTARQLDYWQRICLWGTAAFAPYLLAWMLTRYDIAPMFHYRFVMVSALPLYIFAAYLWLLQSSATMRWLTVLAALAWMNLSQGPFAAGQQGRWQSERKEDWQSASNFISRHVSDQSQLWCYAGLIEGLGLKPPVSDALDEYLSYPMRGSFRITGGMAPPQGLVADRQLWMQQIRHRAADGELSKSPNEIWIVYRGQAERLAADLKLAGMSHYPRPVSIVEFGRVSVVCLRLE